MLLPLIIFVQAAIPTQAFQSCRYRYLYCGSFLTHTLGWNTLRPTDNNNLYRCLGLEREVKLVISCPHGCSGRKCHCHPNTSYCGFELYSELRWGALNDNGLYACNENGTDGNYIGGCPGACHRGRCICITNTSYCGHEAVTGMFHSSPQPNRVYRCDSEGSLVDNGYCPPSNCLYGRCVAPSLQGLPGHCSSGRLYCGYQLNTWYPGTWIFQNHHLKHGLFRCVSKEKLPVLVGFCPDGCSSHSDDASCLCHSSNHYCGDELRNMGWRGYDGNSMYLCLSGGRNASHVETCLSKCVMFQGDGGSHCAGSCRPGFRYCGSRLNILLAGSSRHHNDTIYLCHGGENVSRLFVCQNSTCDDDNFCPCTPGKNYCEHDLYLMGWPQVSWESNWLFECLSNSLVMNKVSCTHGCSQAKCRFPPGIDYLMCGNYLHDLGWHGYDNHTLYRATDENATALARCPTTCRDQACICPPGSTYCSAEAEKFGWIRNPPGVISSSVEICRCVNESHFSTKPAHHICTDCKLQNVGRFCRCQESGSYCGVSLHFMGWRGYNNETLYLCEVGGYNASVLMECPNHTCRSPVQDLKRPPIEFSFLDPLDTNSTRFLPTSPPNDYCPCLEHHTYCGHQLYQMGWIPVFTNTKRIMRVREVIGICKAENDIDWITECGTCLYTPADGAYCGLRNDSLYCGNALHALGLPGYRNNTLYLYDQANISIAAVCDEGCTLRGICRCSPKQTYCGYEVYDSLWWKHIQSNHHQLLFQCDDSREHIISNHPCLQGCFSQNKGLTHSYCLCKIHDTYCGHDLLEMGWQGYENETLYRCVDGHHVQEAIKCPAKCFPQYIEFGKLLAAATCECMPGEQYCGNSRDIGRYSSILVMNGRKPLEQDSVYICPNPNDTTIYSMSLLKQRSCSPHACVPSWPPRCQQRCNPDRQYCASELLSLEGRTNTTVLQGWLHLCEKDGISTHPIQECIAECQSRTYQSKDSVCKPSCRSGYRYCGWQLELLGWEDVDTSRLYTCQNLTQTVVGRLCQRCVSTHVSAFCDEDHCVAGTQHCGSQLPASINQGRVGHLFVCERRRNRYSSRVCKHGCLPSNSRHPAMCKRECEAGTRYCGADLLRQGWHGVFANKTYICHKRNTPGESSSCRKQACRDGACMLECDHGALYCGHDLESLGFEGLTQHTIYKCIDDQPTYVSTCSGLVCHQGKCDPNILRGGCGRPIEGISTQIWSSRNASYQKWPWMVSLQKPTNRQVMCGGTLVSSRWVITAAHCLDYQVDLAVGIGRETSHDQRLIVVTNLMRHPSYHVNSPLIGDVALIQLSQEVPQPACCLAELGDVPPGLRCTVLGWGVTGERGTSTLILQEGTLETLDPHRCQEIEDRENNLIFNESTMICAGPVRQSDTFTCQGDSGGPLLCRNSTDQPWSIYGVISFGKVCTYDLQRQPTAFAKVGAFYNWIQEVITET